MDQRLRAGVVGLGHLGRHHARIYAGLASVELMALCDRRPVAQLGLDPELASVPFFDEAEHLTDRVDLVSIVTPTSTHAELALPFLERGVAVLVEKPMAGSMEEARALVAAAEKSGAMMQVGHIEEFNPALIACRHLIQRPRFVEAHRMGAFSGRSLDVDVVCDLMIHDLDLILEWLGSELNLVHAVGIPVLSREIDIASVRLEFVDGAVANLTASRVSFKPQRRMRLFMPDRYVRLDFLERSAECIEREFGPDGTACIRAIPIEVQGSEPLRLELESFIESVRTRRGPRVDGARAIRALELAGVIKAQMERRVGG